MNWWQILLFPFTILYDLVTRCRNHWYNLKSKNLIHIKPNLIVVGNLEVGGTGKSPMIEYLIEYFLNQKKIIATLSRGYGRSTSGIKIACGSDNANSIGDEPYNYYLKFDKEITVAVAEDRIAAINKIMEINGETDLILLDDAYQHRSVIPTFSILMTNYHSLFYKDFLIPSGKLREARKGAIRANSIIVAGCPGNLKNEEIKFITKKIRKHNKNVPIAFSWYEYCKPKSIFNNGAKVKEQSILVSGIAHNNHFQNDMQENYNAIESIAFRDHHRYTNSDINKLKTKLESLDAMLITTSKDAVKIMAFEQLSHLPCFYIPLKIHFLENEKTFFYHMNRSLKNYSSEPVDH